MILRVRHKNTRKLPRKLFTKLHKITCLEWVHIHQTARAGSPGAGVLVLADLRAVAGFAAGLFTGAAAFTVNLALLERVVYGLTAGKNKFTAFLIQLGRFLVFGAAGVSCAFFGVNAVIALGVSAITFTAGIGYREGSKIITSAKDKLDALTAAATLLGITVVGALVATVVKANVTAAFTSGEITVSGQDILNQIMPCLVPAAFVGFIYWLLGRKKMSSTKAIILVMVLAILLHVVGILG